MTETLQTTSVTDPSLIAGNVTTNPELRDKVTHTLEYFSQEFGLNLDHTGNLATEPTTEQLSALRDWHENTSGDSIQMADTDTFTAKVVLARALMPQRDESGQIQYLFGKGVGAELALQGDVVGRAKRATDVPYRTHSDFEIYGVRSDNYDVLPHSERFRAVFGGQEIYPVTSTKGLHDLPPDYLHKTAETVNYGGLDFLVPSLELQFVDKFEKANEPVERRLREKTDAEWIASTYELDDKLVHSTIDSYVIAPEVAKFKVPDEEAEQTQVVLSRKVAEAKRHVGEDDPQASGANLVELMSKDMFLANYCHNKGITNISELLDPATGTLKDDIVTVLAQDETSRQRKIVDDLHTKHQEVDAMLHAAA